MPLLLQDLPAVVAISFSRSRGEERHEIFVLHLEHRPVKHRIVPSIAKGILVLA